MSDDKKPKGAGDFLLTVGILTVIFFVILKLAGVDL